MRAGTALLLTLSLLTLSVLTLGGCASIGPGSVKRDRFDYNLALTESWKRQVLLNLVKLRYVEPISFVDVGQIVAAYTLESDVGLGATRTGYDRPTVMDNYSVNANVSGKYTDKPTITYSPMTGKAFLRGVMQPIPVQNILQNIQSGVSADVILTMSAASLNGLRNEGVSYATLRPADGRFLRAVALLRSLQLAGVLRIHLHEKNGGPTLGFPKGQLAEDTAAQVAELKALLGLDPARNSFRVVDGHSNDEPGEIAVNCYSILQILTSLAIRVDVPEEDIKAGRATPGLQAEPGRLNPLGARIRSGGEAPERAFASVRFRDRWFWVDDSDMSTKRLFSFILMAFTLTDETRHESQVQLTVPAQ
ncbi:MAG: hypothetical protein HY916_11220 [Desulfovibrio sp.]|jgi:hypothetical protein|nr:hypothetical protein [Desulfovibrio sp.]